MLRKFFMLLIIAPLLNLSAAWSPVIDVSAPGDSDNIGGPVLDVNILNNGVSVWTSDLVGPMEVIRASFYTFGLGWDTPVTISDTALNPFGNPRYTGQGDPSVALNSFNYSVAVWEGAVFIDAPQSDYDGIFSSFRLPDGTWSPVQLVSTIDLADTAANPENPFVDVSDSGLAVVVWTESRDDQRLIMANFLPYGGIWGTPIQLANPFNGSREDTPMVQINSSNNAVAVWKAISPPIFGEIGASTYNSSTGVWTTVTLDTGVAGDVSLPRVGIDDAGNAVAVWIREIGFDDETYQIVSSSFNFATQTWGPVAIISSGTIAVNPISLDSGYVVVDPFGTATAVWTQSNGGVEGVYASRLPLGGTWSAPELISDSPGVDTIVDADGFTQLTVSVDRQGNVIVLTVDSNGVLRSITRYLELGWQPPEIIATVFNTLYREIRLGSCLFAIAQWQNAPEDQVEASLYFGVLPPPTNFAVTGCCQKFVSQKRCLNFLTWDSSPCAISYQIFRNGVLIAVVPGTQLAFTDVLCGSRAPLNYVIVAIGISGVPSLPAVVIAR